MGAGAVVSSELAGMRGAQRWLAVAALVLLVAGTAKPACPRELDCGENCHTTCASKWKQPTAGAYCQATCTEGWYVTNPWEISVDGYQLRNPYQCQWQRNGQMQWVPVDQGNKERQEGAHCDGVAQCPSAVVAPHATCPAAGNHEQCTPECEPGYSPSADSRKDPRKYQCKDGWWEWEKGSTLPRCDVIEDFCPSFDNFTAQNGGAMKPVGQCARTVDSVCEAACADGYERVGGNAIYRCSSVALFGSPTGAWLPYVEDDALVCQRSCPVPALGPVNHSHFWGGCERQAGAACTAQCDPGYERDETQGAGAYVCSESSYTWVPAHGPPMRCKLTGCGSESPLGNGTACPSAPFGATCQSRCKAGFSGNGSAEYAEYTCQADHKWNATRAAVHCSPIDNWCPTGINESLHVTVVGDCSGRVDETCKRSCSQGSAPVEGPQQGPGLPYRCQADRSWKPDYPGRPLVCNLKCGDGVEPAGEHVRIISSCKRLPEQYCKAECEEHFQPVEGWKGSDEYRCVQSADGSTAEWQEGSLECEPKCDPGYAPIDMNKTGSVLPCAACDFGQFSPDGKRCRACPVHNVERSRCLRCPADYGPNPATHQEDRGTRCEDCRQHLLVSRDGKCVPKSLPRWFEDEWGHEKVLSVLGVVAALAVLVLACMFCRCSKKPFQPSMEREASVLRGSFLGGRQPRGHQSCCCLSATQFINVLVVSSSLVVCSLCAWVVSDKSIPGNDRLDTLCTSLSVLSIISIPCIVQRFKLRLDKHNVDMPDGEATSGWFGLVMFIHGVFDLASDGYFCFHIFQCPERTTSTLGLCFLTNMMVAAMTTWYLSFWVVFPTIERNKPAARQWHIKHNKLVTAVIVASACRIESLAILRLRLRCSGQDRSLWYFPIEDKHFHFLQYSGWFHAILADIPHLVVGAAVLVDDDGGCDFPAALSIFFSSGSIIWGTLSRCGQLALADASRVSTPLLQPDPTVTEPLVREIEELKHRIADQQQQIADLTGLAGSTAATVGKHEVRGGGHLTSRQASPLRANLTRPASPLRANLPGSDQTARRQAETNSRGPLGEHGPDATTLS